jgi:hypothetical protein
MNPSHRLGHFVKRYWFFLLVADMAAMGLTGYVLASWDTPGAPDPRLLCYVLVVELIFFVVLLARAIYLLPGARQPMP